MGVTRIVRRNLQRAGLADRRTKWKAYFWTKFLGQGLKVFHRGWRDLRPRNKDNTLVKM